MLAPSWESSVGALAALLNGAAGLTIKVADLYTFTLLGGQVLRYTSNDVALPVNGNTWLVGPILKRSKTRLSVGISVDQLKVQLSAAPTITVNGVPMMQFITRGGLANARLQVDRLFANAAGVATGVLPVFTGRVADISGGRHEKNISVKSDTELLDVMIPRDVYQAGCKNTLFDGRCGLARAGLTVAGSATGASDAPRTSFAHALAQAAGYFSLGVVTFTAGPNTGIGRTVRNHTSGLLTTVQPWPFAVTAGDAFTVTPGCDKQQATCSGKFSNLVRFRGEPYVPAPDTVI
ncbi:MAG: DUF2163 domain-containing protein [Burkholderiaceae bacterium]